MLIAFSSLQSLRCGAGKENIYKIVLVIKLFWPLALIYFFSFKVDS